MGQRRDKGGVYQIICLPTGRLYVGSSKRIYFRWWQHRYYLRLGTSTSVRLQRAWNKHGEEAFRFSILEECGPLVLREREQFYINTLKPDLNLIHVNPSLAIGRPPKAKPIEVLKAEKAEYDRQHRAEQTARKREAIRNQTPEERALHLKKKRIAYHRSKGRGDVDTWEHPPISEEQKAKISATLTGRNLRPRNEPWIAEGISKTSWYRRLKRQTETPEQHEARNAEKRATYHANGDKEREKMRLRYHRSKASAGAVS